MHFPLSYALQETDPANYPLEKPCPFRRARRCFLFDWGNDLRWLFPLWKGKLHSILFRVAAKYIFEFSHDYDFKANIRPATL
jgi:hypothetical protein